MEGDLMFYIGIAAAAILVILAVIGFANWFIHLSKEQKIANIKEWLKWAVVEAEKALGSNTGQLKLRKVYNMAAAEFPFIVKLVPFVVFSDWVDDALVWMDKQIESNDEVKAYIEK